MPVAKRIILLTFLLSWSTLFRVASGQSTWPPAGADHSFPQTLLKTNEIPAMRLSLQDPERYSLYQSVYNWAMVTPPASNSTSLDRRMRARAAKNMAFIRLVNRKPAGGTTLDSLTTAEKTQLETNALSLLQNINTTVESPFSYTEWQWRSKELIDYLTAYDLLRGAGVPVTNLQATQAKLQEFSGNLYTQASKSIFGNVFLTNMKNNHLLMTAAALGMAGVVLNDVPGTTTATQPQTWINAGMYAIDNLLWRDSQRQSETGVVAGYAEGPYYFKYAFLNCLPFFRAFGNFLPDGTYSFTWNNVSNQIRNPYYDPNYDLLYQWITDITLPDGRLPALEDSYMDMAMPELAITGKQQFVRKFYPQNLEPGQVRTLDAQLDGTVDLRANYLAANVSTAVITEKSLTSLPVSGNLIFRSGSAFNGNYLHVYGKNGNMLNNSGGHNHGDAGSFMLYGKGQLMALDAGYLKYDRRNEVGNANNHNLVLVDGSGPVIGSSGAANDAAAYLKNSFELSDLQYGEVHTTYNGANITRKTLSIRGEYYLMADFISAAAAHNFTWQLHGFGLENGTAAQGVFTDNSQNQEGKWQKNGVTLKAHITANGGASSYTKSSGIHETTYDRAESHTTFLVQKNNVLQTQFLAVLSADSIQTTSTTTLSVPGLAALVTSTSAFTDIAFTQQDTVLQTVTTTALPSAVRSDAGFTFFSVDNADDFGQLFLQNGTTLFYGTDQILQSNKRADIAWEQLSKGEYQGYVNKPATLMVKADKLPSSVTGQHLTSWAYNATTGTVTAIFFQSSDFRFSITSTPLPVTLVKFEAKANGKKVDLVWKTASEKDNAHFEVERAIEGKNWETIAILTGQGTTNKVSSYFYTNQPDFSGQIYYRLKQTDLNGSFNYSGIKNIWLGQPETTIKIYPNPASTFTEVQLPDAATGTADFRIYNASGKVVFNNRKLLQAGANKVKLELPAALPAGLYLLQIQVQDKLHNFRLVKQ
jgi:hypothetical protein